MSSVVWEDGHFIAGHVALDLCNTVYRRTPELGAELLDSPETFRRWLRWVGILDAGVGAIDDDGLAAAIGLREALWGAFDAQRLGRAIDPGAIEAVLEEARRGARHVVLSERGALTAAAPEGSVAALALAALQLLLHPPSPPLRACDGCGWLFIDTSRGRRRRWCSMRTCGNEHKVARYRAAR